MVETITRYRGILSTTKWPLNSNFPIFNIQASSTDVANINCHYEIQVCLPPSAHIRLIVRIALCSDFFTIAVF